MNVSAKVAAQSAAGTVTGFITWLVVSVFHTSLPVDVKALLPVVVGVVLGSAAGWLKKETSKVDVAENWVTRIENAVNQVEGVVTNLNPPPPASPPLPPPSPPGRPLA